MTIFPPIFGPAVLAGVLWLVSWRMWRREEEANGYWGGAVGLALGFAAGYALLLSWPGWPPGRAQERLVYLGLAVGAASAFERQWGRQLWLAAGVVFLFLWIGAWTQFESLRHNQWGRVEGFGWTLAWTLWSLLAWGALEHLARNRKGTIVPSHLWFITAASAGAMVLGATASLGQLAGSLAAMLGAGIVLGLWARQFSLAHGAVTVYTLLLSGLLCQAHYYAELPMASALLLIAAPVAALLAEAPSFSGWAAWRREGLRVAFVAVPVGIALFLAYLRFAENQTPPDEGEYVW